MNPVQRKGQALVLILLAAVMFTPGLTGAQTTEPVEIVILVGLSTGGMPEQVDVEVALEEQWNAAHDDIKVRFHFPGGNPAVNTLATMIVSGQPPAIVGPIGNHSLFAYLDYWADLAPYIARDREQLALDDFNPRTLDTYQLEGRQIALPLGIYPSFMFVNETLFQDVGVDLPPLEYGAWTWDDVREKGIRLTRDADYVALGEAGFDPTNVMTYGYVPFWSDFRRAAALFGTPDQGVRVNADGSLTATFNGPEYQAAAQFYHDGVFEDGFIPTVEIEASLVKDGYDPFSAGRVAMNVGHTWMFGIIQSGTIKRGFADTWNVYPVPRAPNGTLTAPLHGETFVMTKDFAYPDAAWEVLKWLNSPEISRELNRIYGAMPARSSLRGDWEAQWLAVYPFLNMDVIYDALNYVEIPSHEGYMPYDNQSFPALNDFWDRLRAEPDLDVPSELDTLTAELQAIWDQGS